MDKENIGPRNLYTMIQQYKEAQLLIAAINLDIFTTLDKADTAKDVAGITGYNVRNTELFLNALASIGLIEKEGSCYTNTPVSAKFLSRDSEVYLGEFLLFRERVTGLEKVEALVKEGPDSKLLENNRGLEAYDFYEWAKTAIPEIYTGRVQSLVEVVNRLFKAGNQYKILDLGGGSGVMGMEIVQALPGSTGVIFEDPNVARLAEELIEERNLTASVSVLKGDFTRDDIGEGYDLIIASGIIDFAKDYLDEVVAKIRDAMNPNGFLYLVSHDVSDDYQSPKESIVGWLSSHLEGLDILLRKSTVDGALEKAGFKQVRDGLIGGAMSHLHGNFYTK